MFGSSGNKTFERLLDKATSNLQLETDWQSILQMCDVIRQGDAQPKQVINSIRKKLTNDNVNTVNYTLQSLESIVKNCGSKVHQEVATRDFMEALKTVLISKPEPIKTKVLELIQCWSFAFRKNPSYKIVEDYFNAIKIEGFTFPSFKEADAMFDVELAPDWKDDTNCFRCRAEFSTFLRKHHCRCCGQIFCANCSSKNSAIPKYGIEKEVRVCDVCYDKLKGNPNYGEETGLPAEYLANPLSKQVQQTPKPEKTDEEFEEELQLALALSQSEQEEKEKKRTGGSKLNTNQKANNESRSGNDSKTTSLFPTKLPVVTDDHESEVNKYIRSASSQPTTRQTIQSGRVQQISGPSPPPSAPYVELKSNEEVTEEHTRRLRATSFNLPFHQKGPHELSNEETNHEMFLFVDELKKFLDIFTTRMKSNSVRGRTITNDTAVQSLFLQLQQMQPKLQAFTKFQEDARGYYESLQDKLTQLKDAREALNALRHDHYERKRREAEERERLRQVQISQKLQYMRQQKQTYYQYQNDVNLKRLQEQERDLQMRLEQQRQLVFMRDQQFLGGLPFNTNQQPGMMVYGQQPLPQFQTPQMQYDQQAYTSLPQQSLSQTQLHQPTPVQTTPQQPYGSSPLKMPQQQPFENTPSSQMHSMLQQGQQQQQPPVYSLQQPNHNGFYNMNSLNMQLPSVPQLPGLQQQPQGLPHPIQQVDSNADQQQQQQQAFNMPQQYPQWQQQPQSNFMFNSQQQPQQQPMYAPPPPQQQQQQQLVQPQAPPQPAEAQLILFD